MKLVDFIKIQTENPREKPFFPTNKITNLRSRHDTEAAVGADLRLFLLSVGHRGALLLRCFRSCRTDTLVRPSSALNADWRTLAASLKETQTPPAQRNRRPSRASRPLARRRLTSATKRSTPCDRTPSGKRSTPGTNRWLPGRTGDTRSSRHIYICMSCCCKKDHEHIVETTEEAESAGRWWGVRTINKTAREPHVSAAKNLTPLKKKQKTRQTQAVQHADKPVAGRRGVSWFSWEFDWEGRGSVQTWWQSISSPSRLG